MIKIRVEDLPQYIELIVIDKENIWNIVTNSFQSGGYDENFESEEDAFYAGVNSIKENIQNHLDHTKQKMNDDDKDLIMEFFNQVEKQII